MSEQFYTIDGNLPPGVKAGKYYHEDDYNSLQRDIAAARAAVGELAELLGNFERKFFRYRNGDWVWEMSSEDELITDTAEDIFKAVQRAVALMKEVKG